MVKLSLPTAAMSLTQLTHAGDEVLRLDASGAATLIDVGAGKPRPPTRSIDGAFGSGCFDPAGAQLALLDVQASSLVIHARDTLERVATIKVDLDSPSRVQWGADDQLYVSAEAETCAYTRAGKRGARIVGTHFRLNPSGTSALLFEQEGGPLTARPLGAKKGTSFTDVGDVGRAEWLDDQRIAALVYTDEGMEVRELAGKKAARGVPLPVSGTPVKSFAALGTTAICGQWLKTKNFVQLVDLKRRKAEHIELPGRASEIEVVVTAHGAFAAINWKKELLSLD